jgi:hypothetical protein
MLMGIPDGPLVDDNREARRAWPPRMQTVSDSRGACVRVLLPPDRDRGAQTVNTPSFSELGVDDHARTNTAWQPNRTRRNPRSRTALDRSSRLIPGRGVRQSPPSARGGWRRIASTSGQSPRQWVRSRTARTIASARTHALAPRQHALRYLPWRRSALRTSPVESSGKPSRRPQSPSTTGQGSRRKHCLLPHRRTPMARKQSPRLQRLPPLAESANQGESFVSGCGQVGRT